MAILNIILLGLNFFFLIYEKKIENRSSEARPTLLWGERSEPQSALGRAKRAEEPPSRQAGTITEKRSINSGLETYKML